MNIIWEKCFKNSDDDIKIKEIPEGKYLVTCVNVKDI
ncbi:hypothetical protein SAMN05421842_1178 [Clostridium uliginosum]|uniref:Uncharacterized protein n=1 Tax=Clostridium uliginosum TaxID=119641 RepID=A0A1I1P1X5_9CLOT|nr:hypothetical protein SAMN05421842_1178 [Clostridium uliginosum]